MAIDFTGSPGGLFRRFGIIACGIRDGNLYLGSTDISAGGLRSVGVRANNIEGQFQAALQYVVDSLYGRRDSARSALSGWKSDLATLAQTAATEQVFADVALRDKSAAVIITELIRQMVGAGTIYAATNDVKANTVSVAVSAASGNVGNGVCVASVKRTDARNNEYVLAEVVTVRCTSDVGLGATARGEPFDVLGTLPVAGQLDFDWPMGSGASTTLNATDCSLDAQSGPGGNLLTNGAYENFTTANTPDNFTILVGAAGVDIFKEASIIYRGSAALKFTGTGGAPLSSVAQTFNSSTGTLGTLKPNTLYAVNFFARKSAGLAAGVLETGLVDGSNADISDDAGTALKLQVAAGTLTTSFAAYNAVFVTPKSLPATQKLRQRASTALTSGESVYIDDLTFTEMTPVYTNGPYVAVFPGATNFLAKDYFSATVANNYAGLIQTYMQRVWDMRALGLQLPSDTGGTETIADSLFT